MDTNAIKLNFGIATLSLMLFTAVKPAYMPATGPLPLGDIPGKVGIITATLQCNQALQKERAIIDSFARQSIGMGAISYQNIMQRIEATQNPLALQALKAYSDVIMYIYQDKAYIINTKFNPYYPVQGIRSSWLNPFAWVNPFSWCSDNNEELEQLINEYDQLATIALKKKPFTGNFMKMTVHSYRNWRKYATVAITAYLLRDIYKRDTKNTIVHSLRHGNFKQIVKNIWSDVKSLKSGLQKSDKEITLDVEIPKETSIAETALHHCNYVEANSNHQNVLEDALPEHIANDINSFSICEKLQTAYENTWDYFLPKDPEEKLQEIISKLAKQQKICNNLKAQAELAKLFVSTQDAKIKTIGEYNNRLHQIYDICKRAGLNFRFPQSSEAGLTDF